MPPSADSRFCCSGCEVVYDLLRDQGLDRYYALARGEVKPAPEVERGRSRELAWLEAELARVEKKVSQTISGAPNPATSQGPDKVSESFSQPGSADGEQGSAVLSLELDVQGIHCAACVWLMEELFRRADGGVQIEVNPALGKVRVAWRRDRFDVVAFVRGIEAFGYRFGPSRKQHDPKISDLTLRLGVAAALTMNVMILSVSFYFGLAPKDGQVFALFSWLSAALSAGVVLVGGWPFFRAAWQGIRRGVLHLDLPIALGILLVFATSLLRARGGRGDLAYFDTLNTFVTLMLTGRWLQQRVVERNRRFLLEDDGADGLFVRRLENASVRTIPVAAVRAGDELLVAPGDLLPVEATLADPEATLSTAWITGESRPATHRSGDLLQAGACNEGRRALRVVAREDFADSRLLRLLRAPPAGARNGSPGRFWDLLSRSWVAGVGIVAATGLLLWWPAGPEHALEVAAALLVVTCPCAIGIATPLAYELVQSRLRRRGVFVRSADLLDRLPFVRTVIFDKTGTLTLGKLELADPLAVAKLPPQARDAAFDMAARSSHPASRAIYEAGTRGGARFTQGATVEEFAGRGMELRRRGEIWRLGSPAFAIASEDAPIIGGASSRPGTTEPHESPAPRAPAPSGELVLSRNGRPVAFFALREAMRHDARAEVSALQRDGYDAWLVSGDSEDRVGAAAHALGIPPARVLARQSPEDKASAVARIDRQDTLFLGDGVNDSLAFARAMCAGTPATDRPLMPSRADFFLLGDGVEGLRAALALAKSLRVVVRRLLAISLVYNALAIAVCLAGLMTPLRAAIAMPATSLSIVLYAIASLGGPRGLPVAETAAARVTGPSSTSAEVAA